MVQDRQRCTVTDVQYSKYPHGRDCYNISSAVIYLLLCSFHILTSLNYLHMNPAAEVLRARVTRTRDQQSAGVPPIMDRYRHFFGGLWLCYGGHFFAISSLTFLTAAETDP